ncbi:RHS repeat-associated core domain-containing protein [Paracidovorax valerianellae]|uniref:RHS repeat-associated core domain-containing protein n=1 Tax=Paracidovorax valerianellae TaxID=187868 RepID=A0A1G7EEU5_9BURK|nr:RHS repeat-associated core domain-containing protein [Paracidovorax valerianellae]
MGGMAAARLGDDIGHVSVWSRLARVGLRLASGIVETLLVAGAVALLAGVSVATMGCGAILACGLLAGFIGGATGWSSYKEKKIQEMTEDIGELEITGKLGAQGAATVLIEKRLAMRAVADFTACTKHPSPEPNFIAEGTDSVFIETFPAARKGDKLVCAAQIATGAQTVFFGGNKTAYLNVADDKLWWETALEIGIGLAMGRGSFLGRVGCLAMGAVVGMAGEWLGRGFRSLIGYPVHPATGGKILDGSLDTDFVLPGPLPIEWRRFYSNHDHRQDTVHGEGWSVPYDIELHVVRPAPGSGEAARLVYVNPQGRHIDMPLVEPGHALMNTGEGIIVGCTAGGHFEVSGLDHIHQQFGPAPEAPGTHVLKLLRLRDRFGHWIALRYDGARRLCGLTDHLGRVLRLDYSGAHRQVRAIHLVQAASGEQLGLLASYRYGPADLAPGQLTEVVDRTRSCTRRFAYAERLMVLQADAGGFECHYAWERAEQASGPERQDGAMGPGRLPLHDRRVVRHWTEDGETYDIVYALAPGGEGETFATDQLGRCQRWQWDRRHNITRYQNPLGHTWQLRWSERRELLACTRPSGATITFQYDENALQSGVVDPLGQLTRILWDSRWFVPLRVTGPDGATWRWEYDDRGLPTTATAPDGITTETAWDASGLPVQIVDANGGRKTLVWNERGLLTRYTDCSGQSTHYTYDGHGQLQSVTDALGQTTRSTFDARGRLVSVALPDGSSQTFEHDHVGRLVQQSDALSRITRYGYNRRGQRLWRVDAEGRQTGVRYDAAHRMAEFTTENGASYRFGYDAADRLIAEERLDGTRIALEYDEDGEVIAITHHPASGDDVFTEIEAQGQDGTLAQGSAAQRAVAPRRTELVRDALGRLTEKRCNGQILRYRHDVAGRVLEAERLRVDGTLHEQLLHTVRFEYDAVGHLVAEHATDALTGRAHRLRHAHDPLGHRIRTELPDVVRPGGRVLQRSLNYLHYGSGHLHRIGLGLRLDALPGSEGSAEGEGEAASLAATLGGAHQEEVHQLIADFERDVLHREVHRSQGSLGTRYLLDPLGRRVGSWTRSDAGLQAAGWESEWHQQQAELAEHGPNHATGLLKQYRYDASGELRDSVHSHKGRSSFQYDGTGRVLQALRLGPGAGPGGGQASGPSNLGEQRLQERFDYDPAGNLLDPMAGSPSLTGARSHGYLRDNLVRVYEDKRYAYDGLGRLVQKKSGRHTLQRFEWDSEDQLVAVTTVRRPGTPEETCQSTRYRYDALGRRIASEDAFGVTEFVWEGMRLIEERRGARVTSYVYEPGGYVPLARIDAQGVSLQPKDHAGNHGKGGPVPQAEDGAEIYYFHADPSGLPEELTDQEGQVRWRASYRTWGGAIEEHWEAVRIDGSAIPAAQAHSKGEPIVQNLRLQGQYLDRDTGLHYNSFRFYDPDIGRFISADPIGLAGGSHLHLYAANPLRWIDPWGLEKYVIIGEGQGAVEAYAKAMRENPKFAGMEFRTIKRDWMSILQSSGAASETMSSYEWERKAVQGNIDWVNDRHAEGYKFIDVGVDAAENRSSFYLAEKQALTELGIKPARGNSAAIAAARAAAPVSSRPKSKLGC